MLRLLLTKPIAIIGSTAPCTDSEQPRLQMQTIPQKLEKNHIPVMSQSQSSMANYFQTKKWKQTLCFQSDNRNKVWNKTTKKCLSVMEGWRWWQLDCGPMESFAIRTHTSSSHTSGQRCNGEADLLFQHHHSETHNHVITSARGKEQPGLSMLRKHDRRVFLWRDRKTNREKGGKIDLNVYGSRGECVLLRINSALS